MPGAAVMPGGRRGGERRDWVELFGWGGKTLSGKGMAFYFLLGRE